MEFFMVSLADTDHYLSPLSTRSLQSVTVSQGHDSIPLSHNQYL